MNGEKNNINHVEPKFYTLLHFLKETIHYNNTSF
jgi:hypothetical protein